MRFMIMPQSFKINLVIFQKTTNLLFKKQWNGDFGLQDDIIGFGETMEEKNENLKILKVL